jgi:carbon storage regulator
MLVLTRRVDESIVINDNIVVTILGVEGDKVKVGITAPREVIVLRQELWQAIKEQSKIAENLVSSPEPASFSNLRQFLAQITGDGQSAPEPPDSNPSDSTP